jgi:hypothetical protein
MDYLYTAHDFVSEFLKLEFKGFLAKIMVFRFSHRYVRSSLALALVGLEVVDSRPVPVVIFLRENSKSNHSKVKSLIKNKKVTTLTF